jgi:AraC-like DNA-binding protein
MSTAVVNEDSCAGAHTGLGAPSDSVRRAFADVEVVRLRSAGHPVRLPRTAGLPTASFVLLYSLPSAGETRVNGDQLRLEPGDCSILRNEPVTATGPAVDLIAVFVPDSCVGVHRQTLRGAEGHVFTTGHGTPNLVASLLTGLAAQLDHYAPSNPSRLAHHVVGLLTLMCADDTGSAKRQLLERSEEYIEAHLADVDLTPDRIAEALHVSSRTLHRVFEAEGVTVGTWIRNRRLERCRLDLADSVLREVPVSLIASRWGLWDPSHFSRLFKSCFGLSPRAYRLAHDPASHRDPSAPAMVADPAAA